MALTAHGFSSRFFMVRGLLLIRFLLSALGSPAKGRAGRAASGSPTLLPSCSMSFPSFSSSSRYPRARSSSPT